MPAVESTLTVVNATPLALKLTCELKDGGGNSIRQPFTGIPLQMLETWTLPFDLAPAEIDSIKMVDVTVHDDSGTLELGRVTLHRADSQVTITADCLGAPKAAIVSFEAPPAGQGRMGRRHRGNQGNPALDYEWGKAGAGPWITFVNDTDFYVEIFHLDEKSEGHLVTLAPRTQHGGFYLHCGWAAKDAFTGELLAMFMTGRLAEQTMRITSAFRDKKIGNKGSQLEPLVTIPGAPALKLIGARGVLPVPDSPDYRTITAYKYGTKSVFNGEVNVKTRLVRCAAVKLALDAAGPLAKYMHPTARDIERLEIIADHVVVGARAWFPATDVTITARVLEFVDRAGVTSAIDTTPIGRTGTAASAKNVAGYPMNASGVVVYEGESGEDGENGGDITLNICQLVVGSGVGGVRFVTRGGVGQAGEKGGHKPYMAAGDGQPSAGKDLNGVVEEQKIKEKLSQTMPFAKYANNWRWPGGAEWPAHVQWNGKPLLDKHLVHLRLIAVDPDPMSIDVNCFFFPSGESEFYSLPDMAKLKDGLPKKITNTRPGNGEDAYPGGVPGKGGNGGNIASTLHPLIDALCDVGPGQPGPPMAVEHGNDPGTPVPAYRASMIIVKRTSHPLVVSCDPSLSVEDVSGKRGKDAPEDGAARTNVPGQPGRSTLIGSGAAQSNGRVISLGAGDARAWADPLVMDAVLACAKDTYRNAFRTEAWRLLAPYVAGLSRIKDLGPEFSSRLAVIMALRQNLRADVDFFGHPPGWVPRLRAETNFAIYSDIRKSATGLLLFARARLADYEQKEIVKVKTEEVSAKLWSEIEFRRKVIAQMTDQLVQARDDIARIATTAAAVTIDVENLRTWAADEAKDKVKAQRVFKGVMKLVGGAMKVVPYGQPYLGMGGDVVAGVGEFDWNKKNAAAQWEPILKGLGGKVQTFLKDNADLIAGDVGGRPPDTTAADRALADQLDSAKDELKAIEAQQAQAAERFNTEWTDGKNKYLAAKKERLKAWQAELAAIADPTQKEKAQSAITNLVAELGVDEAADFLSTGVALKDKVAKLEASIAKASAEEKKRLETEKKELAGFKATTERLEAKRKEAGTAAARRKEDQEKAKGKVKDGLDRLKGIGEGIGTIGAGIAALASPVTREDPEVKQIVSDILDLSQDIETPNKQRDAYRKLLKDLAEIQSTQQTAVRTLLGAQQAIAANTAAISQALTAASDIAHRDQLLSSVDDVRVGRHLREMQTRARDLMQWALYHFVTAFRYEFLMDVPSDIFDIDHLVDAIVKDATVDAKGQPVLDASGKPVTFEKIPAATYLQSEEKVLKDYLLMIAKALLDRRQIKNAPAVREISSSFPLIGPAPAPAPLIGPAPASTVIHIPAPIEVAIPAELLSSTTAPEESVSASSRIALAATAGNVSSLPAGLPSVAGPVDDDLSKWVGATRVWLDALRRDRFIWLNPVDDLRMVGDYRTRGARIKGIKLREIKLDVPANRPRFEFNLLFVHSGISIIYDTSENGQGFDYFYFSKGPNDDPISWNFHCAWNPKEKAVTGVADTVPEDSIIKTLMGTGSLELKQYHPGLYSPLALVLDSSLSAAPEAFPPIQFLDFSVMLEHTGNPPVAAPRR